jgi:hypothetical protein
MATTSHYDMRDADELAQAVERADGAHGAPHPPGEDREEPDGTTDGTTAVSDTDPTEPKR